MKRKSLPDMFVIASVMTDDDALAPPTQVDGMIPAVMKAQLEAALATKTRTRAASSSSLPVIAALPARAPAEKAATKRSGRMAWIPGVVVVGIAVAAVIGTFRGDAHATATEAALVQPAAQKAEPAPAPIAPAVATPDTPPATPEPVAATTPSNDTIDIPVTVPVTTRPMGVVTPGRYMPQGAATTPRVDPPRVAAGALPQPSNPGVKPVAPNDAPAKGKGDADFEAALRAAQRANQQLDQTLR